MKDIESYSKRAADQGLVPMTQENAIVDGPDTGTQRKVGTSAEDASCDIGEREAQDGVPRNYERFGPYAFARRLNKNKLKNPGVVILMLTKDRRVFKQVTLSGSRPGWLMVDALKEGVTHEKWCVDHWRRGSIIDRVEEEKT